MQLFQDTWSLKCVVFCWITRGGRHNTLWDLKISVLSAHLSLLAACGPQKRFLGSTSDIDKYDLSNRSSNDAQRRKQPWMRGFRRRLGCDFYMLKVCLRGLWLVMETNNKHSKAGVKLYSACIKWIPVTMKEMKTFISKKLELLSRNMFFLSKCPQSHVNKQQ